jgi:hypothetical protein
MSSCFDSNINPIAKRQIRNVKGFNPSQVPVIDNLSSYTSNVNDYIVVYIMGQNFLPSGTTSVSFGAFNNIPISYYNSVLISFALPLTNYYTSVGTYDVCVTNINNYYSVYPNILYSNKVSYTLT